MAPSKWEQLRTEARNPATRDIDTLPISGIIDLMTRDVRHAFDAVQREKFGLGLLIGGRQRR